MVGARGFKRLQLQQLRPSRGVESSYSPSEMPRFLLVLTVLASLPTIVAAESAIDFNEAIRPILSNRCFACHGPDAEERKGDLRLDTREGALKALVPGHPEQSLLIERVTTDDHSDLMPPPELGDRLSEEDVATLRQWIEQDAPYARHWAYVRPEAKDLPEVALETWPKRGFDHFVLNRLEREGLVPSTEASRQILARRVALDLTGLPPSMEEMEAFLSDPHPDAYESYVARLLEKPAFGEHWARHWLDLARYADSAGYADDPPRTIWAFRDYVIRSFNANKPFDVFTREQLAGDLLPNPSQDQLIATAFHRNTQTNNEGGTSDEEFRNVAVVDRVNTTFSVWMGTTMACAQCHTHKYDPITHHEYFEAFAIFNNSADADRRNEAPIMDVATPEFIEKKTNKQTALARLEEAFENPDKETQQAFEQWQSAALEDSVEWQPLGLTNVEAKSGAVLDIHEDGWVHAQRSKAEKDHYELVGHISEDQPITALRLEVDPKGKNVVLNEIGVRVVGEESKPLHGQFVRIDLPGDGRILQLAEVEVFRHAENVARSGEARQSSRYANARASRAIDGNTAGDYFKESVAHTAANGNDPWWEVDLGKVQAVDRIVVWNRTDGDTASRLDGFRVSVLDADRRPVWSEQVEKAPQVSLSIPLDGNRQVALRDPSATHSQARFDVSQAIDGDASKDSGWALAPDIDRPHVAVFRLAQPVTERQLKITLTQNYPQHALRHFRLSVTASEAAMVLPYSIRKTLEQSADRRSPRERRALYHYFARLDPKLAEQREMIESLRQEIAEMKASTTVPVMREMEPDKRRKTHVHLRGNWLSLGDEVAPGVPSDLHPLREGVTNPSRLDLADWLMDPDNPLTARVTANRFWEAIFGIGLVRTSEEFGSQGDPPTHPELLDYLAISLVESGWDVKGFLTELVTSATYRQSSKVTPEMLERDPDNRLYARGPRFRLSAEMIRDQALFVSGLLSDKMYGPPVQPRQPDIGLNAAFGGQIDWKTSKGEDQYRRGIYTLWRRSNPYPSMATFDAPNREVCMVRRDRTNTPLQALVTLNDPVYMEAAQALARWLEALGKSPEETVDAAFRRCLGRAARREERDTLTELFLHSRRQLQADAARATALATDPLGPLPQGMDAARVGAWAVVANVVLNLDELFLKL